MARRSPVSGRWPANTLQCAFILNMAVVVLLGGTTPALPAVVVQQLRCEYLKDPLGIDVPKPRLSWVLGSGNPTVRGQRQSGYQILVASSQRKLDADQGDLWDSGKVDSEQSIHVRYAGKPLVSEQECFWKVRVWDEQGQASAWSEPGFWTMGPLTASDWKAKWIGQDGNEPKGTLTDTQWIWFPENEPQRQAPVATRYFRRVFDLPDGRGFKSGRWLVAGDNEFAVYVNGDRAGGGKDFKRASEFDLRGWFHAGRNVLAVSVTNVGDAPNPAGLAALLEIEFSEGKPLLIGTDENWLASTEGPAGWEKPGFDTTGWAAARKLGPVGMGPWGEVTVPGSRRLPARWLRKEFRLDKPVRRAVVHMSGLGLSELYLNGRNAGDHVLSPGLTDYSKRVFYVTHDVTNLLKPGANAAGVVLGNGRFFGPRGLVPDFTRSFGFPKLLFQMRVEYVDGSSATILSDESWRLTSDGPIRANNEYDGEEYDARMEIPGWSEPGLDDSKWSPAQLVQAPAGAMTTQMIEPIRVTETLKPLAITEPLPGVYIFDMGQNMVGWCRLRASGPAGTAVSLRHAERLRPDGLLDLDPLRTAQVTDIYTFKGGGEEVYEPRFTYHGFRFVEVKGFPGKPTLASLEGRVVHDDLESAGDFACSNPLLNRIYRNVMWGTRGNYRSIPTDCPQRDERQGWLGDRAAESRGETYLFNTAAFYAKWLRDMADAQKDNGSVPDVCPDYWPINNDGVLWPSCTVIIPGTLYDEFADTAVLEDHYPSAKRWMDHKKDGLASGIIARDAFGDWCVPPEDPRLIHSNDPNRRTDMALLATAYLYHDAMVMARYARLLGRDEDARSFDELAGRVKVAFNTKFFNPTAGWYDNGSQTSCVLPLAFGLVPEEQRVRVFDHLVRKITEESRNHVGTGLIGGQWLMRVLSDNGRTDLAYTIATQKTYPSWGYMVEKGATTVWELWNGDTAEPTMNSGNHVMLVGDLVTWLYENLAGIKPDPEQPGFKHIVMRPEPVGDLKFVKATHRSPYGLISSEWEAEGEVFRWKITVPVNATATIYMPADDPARVTESGKPAGESSGVRFIKQANGRAVFVVGSGTYSFESR